jgi:hypothetical protein
MLMAQSSAPGTPSTTAFSTAAKSEEKREARSPVEVRA